MRMAFAKVSKSPLGKTYEQLNSLQSPAKQNSPKFENNPEWTKDKSFNYNAQSRLYRYKDITKIGQGSYGRVYKAYDSERNNQVVAIKKMRFQIEEEGL